MADTTALKNRIRAAIKANDNQEITGPVLQQTLLDIVDEIDLYPELQNETNARQQADTQLQTAISAIHTQIDNGYIYAGIATPSTPPVTGKVFYIAVHAGTYTNFGSIILTQGINILKYNGFAWVGEQLLGIDDEPNQIKESIPTSKGVGTQITELSKKLENEVKYFSLIQISNFVSDKFISANGNLGSLGGASVYYLPYTPNTLYKLRYNNAFTAGVMYSWAIYSANNISDVSAANVVAIGPSTVSLVLDECEICSSNTKAKLLCITQYTSKNIILSGQSSSVKEKFDLFNIAAQKEFSEINDNILYCSSIQISDYLDNKFLYENGTLGDMNGYKVYYLPYTPGVLYKLNYLQATTSGVICSWAIYNTNDTLKLNSSTLVAAGPRLTAMGTDAVNIYSLDSSAKLLCITKPSNRNLNIQVESSNVKNKIQNLENINESVQEYIIGIEDEISIFSPIQISNYLDNRYINVNGNILELGPAKVYYMPYTPGQIFKLNYLTAMTAGVIYSWAIYSVENIENANSDNCLAIGPKIVNLGTDISTILSLDSQAKLLCISWYPNYNFVIRGKSETPLIDLIIGSGKSVRYSILDNEVYLAYPYGNVDLLITLNKRGPNELFDFTGISTIPANSVDIRAAQKTAIQGISTDYHVAFMVRAINNADGDNKTGDEFNAYFTGGNHGYDNTGSLENNTATGRMLSLEFYADGRKVVSGAEGTAEQFKMVWKNNIQGYNTTKQDGSGREILQEIHEMIYKNGVFTDTVELIPLEDIYMELCYGLGIRLSHYVNYYFVGGNDRAVHNNETAYSGTKTTNAIVSYGNLDIQELFIDSLYDIGDRRMLNGDNNGAHATAIKAYMNIIKNANMLANAHYSFRGGWIFKPKA